MTNTAPVKMMLTKGDIKKIDKLISDGMFTSRADFGVKAVFLLLAGIGGEVSAARGGAAREKPAEAGPV
ncbi:MAG: hypothetical protein LBV13_05805 [Methanomassiliicoccaceae archaeon]|jgi:Arc/MetJ-type ribon-helix-helix transcriptional regulator|nr:hypothetical protein [Methanomassiliicoccaceae archaeon]